MRGSVSLALSRRCHSLRARRSSSVSQEESTKSAPLRARGCAFPPSQTHSHRIISDQITCQGEGPRLADLSRNFGLSRFSCSMCRNRLQLRLAEPEPVAPDSPTLLQPVRTAARQAPGSPASRSRGVETGVVGETDGSVFKNYFHLLR